MNATGPPSSENFNPRAVDAYEVEVCDDHEQEDHMAGPNSRAMTRRMPRFENCSRVFAKRVGAGAAG